MLFSTYTVLLVIFSCITYTNSKLVEGWLQLSPQVTEIYIAKFSFARDEQGRIEGEFRTHNGQSYFGYGNRSLVIAIYDDYTWPQRLQLVSASNSTCKDRLALARWSHNLTQYNVYKEDENTEMLHFSVSIVKWYRAHYWFTMLIDCSLEGDVVELPKFNYSVRFMNGESHLPADERGLTNTFAVLLVALFLTALVYGRLAFKQMKKAGQLHLIVIFLSIAYFSQIGSVFCEWWHLYSYDENGVGSPLLDFTSEVFQGLSELIISFIMVCMAFGWTLVPSGSTDSLDMTGSAPSSPLVGKLADAFSRPYVAITRLSSATLLIVSLFMSQFVLEILGRQYHGDFNQFHDYEHWPGYLLMLLRIGLCVLFVMGVSSTIVRTHNSRLVTFLRRLCFLGSVWFLAFPVLVVFTSFLDEYDRHLTVTVGAIVLQSLALGFFLNLFLRHSEYLKISTLSQVGTFFYTGSTKGVIGSRIAVD